MIELPTDIVGHYTSRDEKTGEIFHEPLTREEAEAIWAHCEAEKAKRAETMPTVQDAINAMHSAWVRLNELGWKAAIYCPKNGTVFEVVEPGSTGIHKCHYMGEWPDGSWWIHHEDGDMSPSHPVLFRPLPEGDDSGG